MFKNYFKIAVRTLWRSKGYAFINILGLAIGITGATLLFSYVRDENGFDKFHSKWDRTARVITVESARGEQRFYGANPIIMAKTMAEELPEVEDYTTLQQIGGHLDLEIDGKRFSERGYFIADNNFFKVFDFQLLEGDKNTALEAPSSAILTTSEAIKLFGRTDVMGEIIKTAFAGDFKVTGIVKDPPKNSHLQFDILVSINLPNAGWQRNQTSWTSFAGSSYLVLTPNANLQAVEAKVNDLSKQRIGAPTNEAIDFKLQALGDIHFESANIEFSVDNPKGDRSYSLIFTFIAAFLLLIAAVNYMNLATSKSVFRAKEIGIRKVVGAVKKQLVTQFLLESFLISMIALIISIGLTDLSMPFFNNLTGKQFTFSWATLSDYLPLLLGTTLIVGVLSGIYPSVFMTRFKPTDVLKGEKLAGGSFNLRKILVVFQFFLSIVMLICTILVSQQMTFIKERNLGFNEENLMVIDINNGAVRPVFKTMRSEFGKIPGVQSVGVASRVPGEWKGIDEFTVNPITEDGMVGDSTGVFYMSFDENMLQTFDFRLRDGNYFSGNDQSDSTKILINQTAAKTMGLENPIGSTIRLNGRGAGNYTVIGVLEDFNFQSLHTEIQPIVIGAWNNQASVIDYFILKVAGKTDDIIENAIKVHEQFDQRTAMEYHFLESQIELFYETESRAMDVFKAGAGLSIFVACLGLFGLASFTVQKRIKEMGIRKVLGASQWNLFYLLSSSFAKQVLLAFLVACPVAFYFMSNWLNEFVYRVNIGIIPFAVAGLLSIVVALITVSYRSLKAANSNPVNSLRSE